MTRTHTSRHGGGRASPMVIESAHHELERSVSDEVLPFDNPVGPGLELAGYGVLNRVADHFVLRDQE